jgi:hypothetical protein
MILNRWSLFPSCLKYFCNHSNRIRDAGVAGSNPVVPAIDFTKNLLQQGHCIYASPQGSCPKPDSSLRHLSAFRKSDHCGAGPGKQRRRRASALDQYYTELALHIIKFANEPKADLITPFGSPGGRYRMSGKACAGGRTLYTCTESKPRDSRTIPRPKNMQQHCGIASQDEIAPCAHEHSRPYSSGLIIKSPHRNRVTHQSHTC